MLDGAAPRVDGARARARRADRARQRGRRRGRRTAATGSTACASTSTPLMRSAGARASLLARCVLFARAGVWRSSEVAAALTGSLGLGRDPGARTGSAHLEQVLAAVRAQGDLRAARDRLGLARPLARDRARRRGRARRDRAGGVRPRAHAQPRRGACRGRPDLLPHPGRRAGAGLARRVPRGVQPRTSASARPSARTCPAPDTSPMIARELTEFFAGFAPDGRPTLQRAGDPVFLSNVNACYLRDVLGGDPLRRRGVRGGPGLRARDARGRLDEGLPPRRGGSRTPTTTARSSSCRRYFDEYRGLRETIGPRGADPAREGRGPRGDRATSAGCRSAAWPAGQRARWLPARRCITQDDRSSPASDRVPSGCRQAFSGRSRSKAAGWAAGWREAGEPGVRARPVRGDPDPQPRGPDAARVAGARAWRAHAAAHRRA